MREMGIIIKPIRLGKSLYLLVPSQIARAIGITEDVRFTFSLGHGKRIIVIYEAIKG